MRRSLPAGTAIFAVFFLESSVLGHWIPRIPDIKARLGLGDAELGLALLCLPLGTLVGLALAGRVIERTGLAGACRIFLPAWALLFVGPALSPTFVRAVRLARARRARGRHDRDGDERRGGPSGDAPRAAG